MQIFISNNIRITGAPVPLRAEITKELTIDNPAYIEAKRKGRRTWGIEKKLELFVYDQGALVVPRGYLSELEEKLKIYNARNEITIDQTDGQPVNFGPWNNNFLLKDDQVPLVTRILKENGVAVAPAGSGKTVMGMNYIYLTGRATLWLTHTKDLVYQTKARAEATLLGVGRIGIIGDDQVDYGDGKLIIATVQTLQNRPDLIKSLNDYIGVVVIDEAHHFPAASFIDTAGQFKAKRIIGLTATPDRKDGLQEYMYRGIGPKLYTIERDGLYESGRLIKPELKFIFTDFDYDQASIREGTNVDAGGEELDYIALKNMLINDKARNDLIAKTILDNLHRGTTLVITESVRHCFLLQNAVHALLGDIEYGRPTTAVIHGGISQYAWHVVDSEATAQAMVRTGHAKNYKYDQKARRWKAHVQQYTDDEMKGWQVSSAERKRVLAAVDHKQIDVVFATQLAREGLDIAHLNVGVMAMPKKGDTGDSKNGAAVEQEIGRIMRPDPNNPDKASQAIWFDFVDFKVGVFKAQYYSRRKVYARLGLELPKKQASKREQMLEIDKFLSMPI